MAQEPFKIFILSEKTLAFMPGMRVNPRSEEERTTAFRPWESIFDRDEDNAMILEKKVREVAQNALVETIIVSQAIEAVA